MAEEQTSNGAAAAETTGGAQFAVQRIYIKDVSFESPNAPQVFAEQEQPKLQLNMAQTVNRVGEDNYEVVLTVTVTCTVGEKTVYLVEIKQAGVFLASGFDERNLDYVLATQCPAIIYPYARQTVSDLIQGGGFSPFYLQPLNFDALYQENLRRRAEQQAEGGSAAPEVGHA